MSAATNRALEERYLREVWGERNPEAEARFAAPDYRRHISPTEPPLDLAGQVERERRFFVAFPDGSIEALEILADDRHVVIRGVGRGTNLGEWSGFPPTGRSIEIDFVSMKRVEEGRFVEQWGGPNRLDMAIQLGLALATG